MLPCQNYSSALPLRCSLRFPTDDWGFHLLPSRETPFAQICVHHIYPLLDSIFVCAVSSKRCWLSSPQHSDRMCQVWMVRDLTLGGIMGLGISYRGRCLVWLIGDSQQSHQSGSPVLPADHVSAWRCHYQWWWGGRLGLLSRLNLGFILGVGFCTGVAPSVPT